MVLVGLLLQGHHRRRRPRHRLQIGVPIERRRGHLLIEIRHGLRLHLLWHRRRWYRLRLLGLLLLLRQRRQRLLWYIFLAEHAIRRCDFFTTSHHQPIAPAGVAHDRVVHRHRTTGGRVVVGVVVRVGRIGGCWIAVDTGIGVCIGVGIAVLQNTVQLRQGSGRRRRCWLAVVTAVGFWWVVAIVIVAAAVVVVMAVGGQSWQ